MNGDHKKVPSRYFVVYWMTAAVIAVLFMYFIGGWILNLIEDLIPNMYILDILDIILLSLGSLGYFLLLLLQSFLLRIENHKYTYWFLSGLVAYGIGVLITLILPNWFYSMFLVRAGLIILIVLFIVPFIQMYFVNKDFHRSYLWIIGNLLGYICGMIWFTIYTRPIVEIISNWGHVPLYKWVVLIMVFGIIYGLISGIFLRMVLSRPREINIIE